MSKSDMARFFQLAIRTFRNAGDGPERVMDFGCGSGRLVESLVSLGIDAHGCDIAPLWSAASPAAARLSTMLVEPYRLPFESDTFDAVVSTSVLEHAQNKKECFREIHRVLKPGGVSMHVFPSKFFLPREPHVGVPLMNWLWPNCPTWWLSFWAFVGVRNSFQQELNWRTVAAENHRYGVEGLSYWTTQQYEVLSRETFGNCAWPMSFYLNHAPGGMARILRRMPFTALSGVLSREVRYSFLLHHKHPQSSPLRDQ